MNYKQKKIKSNQKLKKWVKFREKNFKVDGFKNRKLRLIFKRKNGF